MKTDNHMTSSIINLGYIYNNSEDIEPDHQFAKINITKILFYV